MQTRKDWFIQALISFCLGIFVFGNVVLVPIGYMILIKDGMWFSIFLLGAHILCVILIANETFKKKIKKQNDR